MPVMSCRFFSDACQTGKIPLECLSGHSGAVCVGAVSPGAATEDAGPPAHVRPGSRARWGRQCPGRVCPRPPHAPCCPRPRRKNPDVGCPDPLVSARPDRNRLWIFPVLADVLDISQQCIYSETLIHLTIILTNFVGPPDASAMTRESFIISHCSAGTEVLQHVVRRTVSSGSRAEARAALGTEDTRPCQQGATRRSGCRARQRQESPRPQRQGRQAGADQGTRGFCVDRSQATSSRTPKTKQPGEESDLQPTLNGIGHCLEERKADASSRRWEQCVGRAEQEAVDMCPGQEVTDGCQRGHCMVSGVGGGLRGAFSPSSGRREAVARLQAGGGGFAEQVQGGPRSAWRMGQRGRRWGQVGGGRCPDRRGWSGLRPGGKWMRPGRNQGSLGEGLTWVGAGPTQGALSTSPLTCSLTTVFGHGDLVSPAHPCEK